jgi:FkbM family methyltransferase
MFATKLRKWGRSLFDSMFCKTMPSKISLGNPCAWHIDSSLIRKYPRVVAGGVGNDVSFELELAKSYGCKVVMYDPSETGVATARKTENQHANVAFFPKGLAALGGAFEFSKPRDTNEGSFTIPDNSDKQEKVRFECVTVSQVLSEQNWTTAGLLKIDVEGFEYGILDNVMDNCPNVFSQICVEFHHFMPGIKLTSTLRTIRKMQRNGYRIVHKSQCDYLFVRKEFL